MRLSAARRAPRARVGFLPVVRPGRTSIFVPVACPAVARATPTPPPRPPLLLHPPAARAAVGGGYGGGGCEQSAAHHLLLSLPAALVGKGGGSLEVKGVAGRDLQHQLPPPPSLSHNCTCCCGGRRVWGR
ncbi:unnamed protein product [Closterium sp. NIES-54]